MVKVLVVGGSRFIGKHVVAKVAEKGHKLTVANRGSVEQEKYLPKGAEHITIDRNDREKVKEIFAGRKFDVTLDICAVTKNHVEILFEALGEGLGRFVHVSSGSVYELNEDKITSYPITEDHVYPEINEDTHPYVKSKTEAEQYLFNVLYKEKGIPVVSIRPTFVYGPDNYVYREGYFYDRISRPNRPVLLPNKGDGFNDFVHVDDVAELIMIAGFADADKVVGEAFNASRGRISSGNMLVKIIADAIGNHPKILYYTHDLLKELNWPMDKMLFPFYPTGCFSMSTDKCSKVLGFEHEYTYETGFAATYDWWKDQEHPEPDFTLEDILINLIEAQNDENEDMIDTYKSQIKEEIEALQKKKEEEKEEQSQS